MMCVSKCTYAFMLCLLSLCICEHRASIKILIVFLGKNQGHLTYVRDTIQNYYFLIAIEFEDNISLGT